MFHSVHRLNCFTQIYHDGGFPFQKTLYIPSRVTNKHFRVNLIKLINRQKILSREREWRSVVLKGSGLKWEFMSKTFAILNREHRANKRISVILIWQHGKFCCGKGITNNIYVNSVSETHCVRSTNIFQNLSAMSYNKFSIRIFSIKTFLVLIKKLKYLYLNFQSNLFRCCVKFIDFWPKSLRNKKGYKRDNAQNKMKSGYSLEWISTKAEQDEKLPAIFI